MKKLAVIVTRGGYNNLLQACEWITLAASHGVQVGVLFRDEAASKMTLNKSKELTFSDGYRGRETHVREILRELDMKAVVNEIPSNKLTARVFDAGDRCPQRHETVGLRNGVLEDQGGRRIAEQREGDDLPGRGVRVNMDRAQFDGDEQDPCFWVLLGDPPRHPKPGKGAMAAHH